MKKLIQYITLAIITACTQHMHAQELFPLTEPASTLPKGVLGTRYITQTYNEVDKIRNLFALRAYYGLTPKLTIMATANVSNHHNKDLPPGFPEHNTPQIGVHHPYLFNGVDFYAKYRFITHDGENSHLRMAGYGEYSYLKVAHDEGEPTLLDDTKGFGAGIIATYLKNHFALSVTSGFIIPQEYQGDVADFVSGLTTVPAKIIYGNAASYSLSFGYLLYPQQYKSYNQTNWNIYVEFIGKTYNASNVYLANIGGDYYPVSVKYTPVLHAGNYVEINPSLQCIVKSNLRIDASVGFPLINKSYVHYYPLYTLGIQRYFYFNKHK